MTRLSNACLSQLPADVQQPNYDRKTITPGIVHLGIGAFHRAHQAVYIDDLLANNPDWAIIGASLRRPDTKNALQPQDGLYTIAVRDADGTRCRVVGSIVEVVDAAADPAQLLDIMVDPKTRIVSLTVTEKGYCHDPATGELDEAHPDIVHDMANPSTPRSAPGFIIEALARRKAAGVAPFAVMSCDNLPENGRTAQRIVTRMATLRDKDLGGFVRREVAFPGTMVDRIVPATTEDDRAVVADALGCEDAWPIMTEPFTQWVIEDNFPQGRPPFEKAGAEMVADVEPFERMKLRLLNGAHSTMAYLGYLSGFETISQTISNEALRTLVHDMMTDEIIPTLELDPNELAAYRDALLQRFSNPALQHRTWQIAMDGSQKLPQRLLDTIHDRLSGGHSIERLALGVAGWIRYAGGIDDKGDEIDVRDPHADKLRAITVEADGDPEALVHAFLKRVEIFGGDLPTSAIFQQQLITHMRQLLADGALKTVEKIVAG